ncbi:transcriptional regulator, partial [Rhizobium ruizarguesonis]
MKKVQRSFAVEYRSGRRKLNSKPNSIWGDTDLKSVARDLQDEAMPFMSLTPQARSSEMLVSGEEQAGPLLTLPIEQETNAPALQETIMADENNTTTNADTPAAATPNVPKKVRKPRAKKVVPATAAVAVSAEPVVASGAAAGKQKRGRRPK